MNRRHSPESQHEAKEILRAALVELDALLRRERILRLGQAARLSDRFADFAQRWGWLAEPPPPLALWRQRVAELLALRGARSGAEPRAQHQPRPRRELLWDCLVRSTSEWPDPFELAREAGDTFTWVEVCLASGRAHDALGHLRREMEFAAPGRERARCLAAVGRAHESLGQSRLALGAWDRAGEEDAGRIDAHVQALHLAGELGDVRRERRALQRLDRNACPDTGQLLIELQRLSLRAPEARVLAGDRAGAGDRNGDRDFVPSPAVVAARLLTRARSRTARRRPSATPSQCS